MHHGLPAMPQPPSQLAQPLPYQVRVEPPRTADNMEDFLAATESHWIMAEQDKAQQEVGEVIRNRFFFKPGFHKVKPGY